MEEKLAEKNEKNEKLKLENKDLNNQLKDLKAQINSRISTRRFDETNGRVSR